MSPFSSLRAAGFKFNLEAVLSTFAQIERQCRDTPDVSYEEAQKIARARLFFEEFKKEHAAKYPVDSNSFYEYLQERSKHGFTKDQAQLFRDNFFYRTKGTAWSVVMAMAGALKASDYKSAAAIGQNAYEETGKGKPEELHLALLENAFNPHFQEVFAINPLLMKDVENSQILDRVKFFRDLQREISTKGEYPEIIGRLFAHEREADGMLDNVKGAFFTPYSGFHDPESYQEIISFFLAHSDPEEGVHVEDRHAKDAEEAAVRAIASDSKNGERLFAKGATEFSESQKAMWDQMLKEMKNREHGVVVEPRPASKELMEQIDSILGGKKSPSAGVAKANAEPANQARERVLLG